MEINWFIIGAVAICAIVLIIFLIKQNQKDEKELEDFLNRNEYDIKKDQAEVNDHE